MVALLACGCPLPITIYPCRGSPCGCPLSLWLPASNYSGRNNAPSGQQTKKHVLYRQHPTHATFQRRQTSCHNAYPSKKFTPPPGSSPNTAETSTPSQPSFPSRPIPCGNGRKHPSGTLPSMPTNIQAIAASPNRKPVTQNATQAIYSTMRETHTPNSYKKAPQTINSSQ